MTRHIILGTAGHIDHGKTTLVHALTGIDTTRFQEERERGMTIDIGFAYLDLPDGNRLGIVDVPGHERFVRNMLAGSAGVDLVLLVVDVNEGVMPQTREHLDIVNLLGVESGCVALTKIDTAEPEFVEIVTSEVADALADTTLAGARLIPVSAATGEGLNALRDEIARLAAHARAKSDAGLCRLPIDRVFTMKGHGTVVTGTLTGGTMRVNDDLIALPCGVTTRVRQLQSHGASVEEAHAGTRVAINCSGVATEALARGETFVHPGAAEATGFFDAEVTILPRAAHPLKHRTKVKCYLGTASVVATPVLLDADEYGPGVQGFAQLRLDRPLLALRGDRFILRTGSPEITVGGGRVLDPFPAKLKRRTQANRDAWLTLAGADETATAVAWLRGAPEGLSAAALGRRLGVPRSKVGELLEDGLANGAVRLLPGRPDPIWVHREVFDTVCDKLRETVRGFFEANPTRMHMAREAARAPVAGGHGPALAEAALAHLVESGDIEDSAAGLRLAGRRVELPPRLAALRDEVLALYRQSGNTPPLLSHLAEELRAKPDDVEKVVTVLQEAGVLLRINANLAYERERWQAIAQTLTEFFETHETLAVADLKDLLGVTRKHAMPILEYADATGLTMRRVDVRVKRR